MSDGTVFDWKELEVRLEAQRRSRRLEELRQLAYVYASESDLNLLYGAGVLFEFTPAAIPASAHDAARVVVRIVHNRDHLALHKAG